MAVVEKGLIPDILREAGPKVGLRTTISAARPQFFSVFATQGLHINDIVAINKLDPNKLGERGAFTPCGLRRLTWGRPTYAVPRHTLRIRGGRAGHVQEHEAVVRDMHRKACEGDA